jgi:hypothetical protein
LARWSHADGDELSACLMSKPDTGLKALPPAYPQNCQQNPGITCLVQRIPCENAGHPAPFPPSPDAYEALIKKPAKY